jgi:hypothetical protein
VPPEAAARARDWERHVVEVETGLLRGLADTRGRRSPTPLAVPTSAWSKRSGRHWTGDVTLDRLRRRVEAILAERHGAGVVPLPSRATFYRLVNSVAEESTPLAPRRRDGQRRTAPKGAVHRDLGRAAGAAGADRLDPAGHDCRVRRRPHAAGGTDRGGAAS